LLKPVFGLSLTIISQMIDAMNKITLISLMLLVLASCRKDEYWPINYDTVEQGEAVLMCGRTEHYQMEEFSFEKGVVVGHFERAHIDLEGFPTLIGDMIFDFESLRVYDGDDRVRGIVKSDLDFWQLTHQVPSDLAYRQSVAIELGETYIIKTHEYGAAKIYILDHEVSGTNYAWIRFLWEFSPFNSFGSNGK